MATGMSRMSMWRYEPGVLPCSGREGGETRGGTKMQAVKPIFVPMRPPGPGVAPGS